MKSGPALAAATLAPHPRRCRRRPAVTTVLPLPEAGAAKISPLPRCGEDRVKPIRLSRGESRATIEVEDNRTIFDEGRDDAHELWYQRHDDPSDRRSRGRIYADLGVSAEPEPRTPGREPVVAGTRRTRPGGRQGRPLLPILCLEDAAPHDPRRRLHRQRQDVSAAPDLAQEDRRQLDAGAEGGRRRRRRHRLRYVHAFARRPCRLEYAARKRPLGAHLSER